MGKENRDDFWNGFVQGMQMNPITMLLLSIGLIATGDTDQTPIFMTTISQ